MKIQTKNYAWIIVAILWFVSMLNYFDRLLIASMRNPIKESIPMNDAQFGLLTSVFLVVYAVLSPLGGYLADRFSRKWVILSSLLIWSVITLWTGFVQGYAELLVTRSLMGISEAFYMPAAVALVMDYHKGSTRSLASGILMTGLYAGMALGGLGGYIATIWDWRFGYQFFGAVGIVYAVIVFFFLNDAPKTDSSSEEDAKENSSEDFSLKELLLNLFRTRGYITILIYGGTLGMSLWLIYAWLPTFFKEGFNLSLGKAGISGTAFIQVASLVGVLGGGYLTDKWVRKNKKARIYLTAFGLIIGGPFLYLMAATNVFFIAIVGITIFGLSKGIHDANFMPIITETIDKKYTATGYGIMSFISVMVGAIMIYVGGLLKDMGINLDFVFKISAVGVLISGFLLLTINPKKKTVNNIEN